METYKIKPLRLARAWSQEQLAELSGLSVRTIQRIENGDMPGLETQRALAAAFQVSLTELQQPASQVVDNTLTASDPLTGQAHRQRFKYSLLRFIVVNGGLVTLNLVTRPEVLWFVWPLLIWGSLLLLRGVKLFYCSSSQSQA